MKVTAMAAKAPALPTRPARFAATDGRAVDRARRAPARGEVNSSASRATIGRDGIARLLVLPLRADRTEILRARHPRGLRRGRAVAAADVRTGAAAGGICSVRSRASACVLGLVLPARQAAARRPP